MVSERATQLVQTLASRGLTCATAESCTGGGVGSAITAVPGSSAVFRGGIISYASEVKHDLLGVTRETIDSLGVVSAECAEQMAAGAQKALKANLAVSVTGVAGPGPDGDIPAGFVWFGISDGRGVRSESRFFNGDRDAVREAAIAHAIEMLLSASREQG